MGYAWSRCRRCARRLTNPDAIKRGVGDECLTKTGPLVGRASLMDSIDAILDGADKVPVEDRAHAREAARRAIPRLEQGRKVTPKQARFLHATAARIRGPA